VPFATPVRSSTSISVIRPAAQDSISRTRSRLGLLGPISTRSKTPAGIAAMCGDIN
jgi:hypothetical protein